MIEGEIRFLLAMLYKGGLLKRGGQVAASRVRCKCGSLLAGVFLGNF